MSKPGEISPGSETAVAGVFAAGVNACFRFLINERAKTGPQISLTSPDGRSFLLYNGRNFELPARYFARSAEAVEDGDPISIYFSGV